MIPSGRSSITRPLTEPWSIESPVENARANDEPILFPARTSRTSVPRLTT